MFKSKRKVTVHSQIFNLAGDIKDRPVFMKTLLFDQVLHKPYASFAEALSTNYLRSAGIQLRKLVGKAEKLGYYDAIGQSSGKIITSTAPDSNALLSAFRYEFPDEKYTLKEADFGTTDIDTFAYAYILENYQEYKDNVYESFWDAETNRIEIIIDLKDPDDDNDDTPPLNVFTTLPAGSTGDAEEEYLYILYREVVEVIPEVKDGEDVEPETEILDRIFIYRKGSGKTHFDDLYQNTYQDIGMFFPIIPVKTDLNPGRKPNPTFIEKNDKVQKGLYDLNVKIFKEFSDKKGYETLLKNLKDNDEAAGINYIYIMFGVPINTIDRSAKKYIYHFFDSITDLYSSPGSGNTISLSTKRIFNLNYKLSWSSYSKSSGSGMYNSTIKVGEVIIGTSNPTVIVRQISPTEWKSISVSNLQYTNTIHRGKSLGSTAVNEFATNRSTEESELLIPLHNTAFKRMSLVDATQMATSCSYMLLNYYSETKSKWYESGAFKIIMIIIIVVVSVYTGGAAAAAGGGLAGVGGAAATALGLTGLAATVFAAIANAIAGLIISRIITTASTAIFGEKIGLIIGVIVSMVAITSMNNYFAGKPINLADAFKASNVLEMTTKVAGDLSNSMQKDIMDMQKRMQNEKEEFDRESDKLNQRFMSEFGNRGVVDPLKFLEAQEKNQLVFESPDQFFARTLMTGSDISEITISGLIESLDVKYSNQV